MDSPHRHHPGLFHTLQSLQTVYSNHSERTLCWNESTINRIFPDDPLTGHTGCVNRLAWNETGDLLASAGDDTDIRLWPFPNLHDSKPIVVPTRHNANIFGLQFLPQSSSTKLLSGAMDHSVQLHTTLGSGRSDDNEINNIADVQTVEYNCHRGRIKEIQVHAEEPSLFWSVSEDGTIRQYDQRVPTASQNGFECANVLLAVQKRKRVRRSSSGASRSQRPSFEQQQQNLNNVASPQREPVVYRSFSRTQQDQFNATTNLAELKSLTLNPLRPMQIAVAASDKYVRIYDRRLLSVGTFENAAAAAARSCGDGSTNGSKLPAGLVTELMPPHFALGRISLPGGGGADHPDCYPTHITFSNCGDKLLASYHGNHAFMWSTPSLFAGSNNEEPSGSDAATPANFSFHTRRPVQHQRSKSYFSNQTSGVGPYNLPPAAETHRLAANLALYDREYVRAMYEYNAALRIVPQNSILLTGRALVLLSRDWIGDKIEALRDAEDAVYYDFENLVGQLRRAQALFDCLLLKSAAVAIRLCRFICYQDHNGISVNGTFSTRDEENCDYEDELRRLEEKLREKMGAVQQEKTERQQNWERERILKRRRGLNLHRRNTSPANLEFDQRRNSSDANNTAAQEGPLSPMHIEEEEEDSEEESPRPPQNKYWSEENEEDSEEEDTIEYGPVFLDRLDKAFAESLERDLQSIAAAGGSCSSSLFSPSWLWGALPSSSSYLHRFVGHCNIQTDIKEAVFIGQNDSFVAAGSDDGRIYVYDTSSGVCLRTLKGDDDIVNCIRPHPYAPVIASSGIDSTIKLWSPSSMGMMVAANEVEACCAANQTTLNEGVRRTRGLNERLFEILTQHPGLFGELNRRVRVDLRHGGDMALGGHTADDEEDEDGEGGEGEQAVECRVV